MLSSSIKTAFQLLSEGRASVPELINSALDKAQKIKKYNAFITVTEKEAQERSHQSSERHKLKKPLSELDGIPIAVKDNFCTSRIKTTCASKMLENFTPTYNATVYERLINSGAVLIGKTNLDQFAMGSGTVDSIYGPSKNPWGFRDGDDFHISGGSSGGSAISVATGTCFGAIGSDTGGSTRNPASYCGLVGLKPTYGLVSRHGLIPLVNSMDVPGILTRNVDDCVAILNCVAGFDPKDSTSLTKPFRKIRALPWVIYNEKVPMLACPKLHGCQVTGCLKTYTVLKILHPRNALLPPAGSLSINKLRIGIPNEYHCEHLSEEVLETWNDVANFLESSGAKIKRVSMPNTEHSIVCYSILNQCEVASNMARYDGIEYGFRADEDSSTEKLFAASRSSGFNEVVRNRILTGNYFLLTRNYEKYFNQALKVRRLILEDFDNVWDEVQVLLTPTTLTTAPLYKDFIRKTNRDQCALQDYCTQPANMAGVPAVTIPIKLSSKGMPISLQLMGTNLSEPMLLALAKYIENAVQFEHHTDI